MSEASLDVPVLLKRRLQAEVIGPILAEMVAQVGEEKAAAILDAAIRKAAIAEGKAFAARAPEGKHVLWVQVRVLPAAIRGDAKGEIAGTDWDGVKEAYADRVMAILESYAPGIGAKVLGRSVFSPVDLERENPNLIGGDNLSGSHHLDQNFLFRPVAGYSRYKMPLGKLYMCGAATCPGAGTGAGSGYLLGKMLAGQ